MVSRIKLAILLSASLLLGLCFSTCVEAQEKSKSGQNKSSIIKRFSQRIQQLEEQALKLNRKTDLSEDDQRMVNQNWYSLTGLYASLGEIGKSKVCISRCEDKFWREVSYKFIAKAAARNGDFDTAVSAAKKYYPDSQNQLFDSLSTIFLTRNDLEHALKLQNMIPGERVRYFSHLRLLRRLLSKGKKNSYRTIRNKIKYHSKWDDDLSVLTELAANQFIESDIKGYKSTELKIKKLLVESDDLKKGMNDFHWLLAPDIASNSSWKTVLKIIDKIDDRITRSWSIRNTVAVFLESGKIQDAWNLARDTKDDSSCILVLNYLTSRGKYDQVFELLNLIDDLSDKLEAMIQIQQKNPPHAVKEKLLKIAGSHREKEDRLRKNYLPPYVEYLCILGEFYAISSNADQAEASLKKAIHLERDLDYSKNSLFTHRFDVMTQIGKVYRILGKRTEALKFQKKAVESSLRKFRHFGFNHHIYNGTAEITRELIRLEAYDVLNNAFGKDRSSYQLSYQFIEIASRLQNTSDLKQYRKWIGTISNPYVKLQTQLALMRRELEMSGFPIK